VTARSERGWRRPSSLHAPHRDAAERSELLAQELGKAVGGNHSPPLVLARQAQFPRDRGDVGPSNRTIVFIASTPMCKRRAWTLCKFERAAVAGIIWTMPLTPIVANSPMRAVRR
jgi:hypothetical protein